MVAEDYRYGRNAVSEVEMCQSRDKKNQVTCANISETAQDRDNVTMED